MNKLKRRHLEEEKNIFRVLEEDIRNPIAKEEQEMPKGMYHKGAHRSGKFVKGFLVLG